MQINQINSFRFQEPSNVFYVSAIVRNVSIDMFKKKNKHQTDNISEDIIYQSEPELPENPLLEKISHDEILDFLNNLPPLQRNVLILTCLSELSTSETAEVLKISKSAVYQRLYLAIKSIRTFIEGRNNK
ncbi:MAG: RNA polymerase sigma factor [Oscillospiraceae bacterium]